MRTTNTFGLFESIRHDLIYTGRTLAKSPAFTAVAILSLALGIGANTAIFTLWNNVLRSPLPGVQNPEQLVMLSDPDQAGSWSGRLDGPRPWLTYSEFEDLRDHVEAFSGVMASQSSLDSWQVRYDGGPWEEVTGRFVSGSFFPVLGVGAEVGHLFTAADDRSESPHVVLSYSSWQRRFGGRPDVVGKPVIFRNAVLTIAGVAPRGFAGETSGQQPDIWLPLTMQPRIEPERDRLHDTPPSKSMWLHVFARLKPGVTAAQAETQSNAVFRAGLESFYGPTALEARRRELLDQRLQIRSGARGASSARPEFSQPLAVLLAAVGVLLLIACANLANLLLARGAARRSEIALRLSLGASRGRLIRQLVTESLSLAALGGAAAIVVASILHDTLVTMFESADPDFRMNFVVDSSVWVFVAAATVATAILFGVLPAWQATNVNVVSNLKDQGRGATGTRGALRSGRLLVSVQIALSLPLLVGAGLLARTVYNLQRADLGFPSERLLLVRVDLREAGYDETRRDGAIRDLIESVQRVPGIAAVSYSELGVFSGGESGATIEVEGYVPKGDDDRESAFDVVGPRYFSTMGAPVLVGREGSENDSEGAPLVCVINEAFAKRFFDGRDPIGMRITAVRQANRPSYQVVGVAKNIRTQTLRDVIEPRYYVPAGQMPSAMGSPTFLIRTSVATSAPMMASVRNAIQRVNPALPIMSAASIGEQVAPLTAPDRTTAELAVVFGGVALTLAAIGLYGLLSYGVARRTAEIAIRIALGARSTSVVSMILGETIGLVAIGLALGGAIAYAAARFIGSRLYGVAPQDPLTIAAAIVILLIVALASAFLPAHRASKLDPMAVLR